VRITTPLAVIRLSRSLSTALGLADRKSCLPTPSTTGEADLEGDVLGDTRRTPLVRFTAALRRLLEA